MNIVLNIVCDQHSTILNPQSTEILMDDLMYFVDVRFLQYLSQDKNFGDNTYLLKSVNITSSDYQGVYREMNANLYTKQKCISNLLQLISENVQPSDIPNISFEHSAVRAYTVQGTKEQFVETFNICMTKNNVFSKKYVNDKFDKDVIFKINIDKLVLFLKRQEKSKVVFSFSKEEKKFLYNLMFFNYMFNPFFCCIILQNVLKKEYLKLHSKNNIFIDRKQDIEYLSYAPDGSKNNIEFLFESILLLLIENCYYSLY